MSNNLFDTVVRIVNSWKPKKRYRKEERYRDDLVEFLRKRLYGVRKESGRHLCDIGVGEKVGIELKRNLRSTNQVDRLRGQLERFQSSYPSGLIVVLVGKTGATGYEDVLSHVRGMSSQGARVKVVDKGGGKVKKPKKRRKKRRRKEKKRYPHKHLSAKELLGW